MLKMKVGNVIINHRADQFPTDSYGLEIEMESEGRLPDEGEFREQRDGSLRGGNAKEYVLRHPASSLEDLVRKIESFYMGFSHKIAPSYRAATHLHMNVMNNTFMEVANILFKYYAVEEVFAYHFNPDRYENPFSLNLKSAEFPIISFLSMLRKKSAAELNNDDLRYSSLNLASLTRKGTMEFRAFETSSEVRPLLQWVEGISSLKRETCRSPKHFLEMFNDLATDQFLRSVYGEPIHSLARKVPDYKAVITRSIRNFKVWINEANWT